MSPEVTPRPIQLNNREQKVVSLARTRVLEYRSSGNKPKQFLIKIRQGESFNIRSIAQTLHFEGITLSEYSFSEKHGGHIFRPMPYGQQKSGSPNPQEILNRIIGENLKGFHNGLFGS